MTHPGAGTLLGTGAGMAAAGLTTVAGVVLQRLWHDRAQAVALGTDDDFTVLPQQTLQVAADDGVPLHVEIDVPDEPEATRPTVVLSHGYTLDLRCWYYQRLALRAAGYPVVVWDQRGHGSSGPGEAESYHVEQLGADLRRVLEEAAPAGPLVLVGHSMGGMTVMALAERHPELFGDRVIGVALLSTSPGRLADVTLGAPALVGRVGHRLAPGVLRSLSRTPEIYERGWRLGSDLTFVLTKRYSYASDVSPRLVEFTAEMLASTPISVVSEFFPAFSAHDKLDALPVLHGVETLVLCGDSDLMTPPSHSEDIVEAVPAAELVLVPDGGHLVMLEHPETVNEALRFFVARARRSAG